MGVDQRRHVLIKDRFEDAVSEIVATQEAVKEIAGMAAQDRKKINLIGGRLEGVAGEVIDTQDSVKEIAGL